MKKRRIVCALLAAVMAVSGASCGSSDSSSDSVSDKTSAEDNTEDTSEEETDEDTSEKETDEETSGEDTDEDTSEKGSETEEDTDEASGGSDERVDINDYLTDEAPHPALWKVTDPESGNELYMMGTIHVVSTDGVELPDYIMDVYNNCDAIAVEYNVNELETNMELMQEFITPLVYQDGTTIKDHISEETYEKAKAYLEENGMYYQFYDLYTPGFWINLMSMGTLLTIDNMDSNGIDSTFISYAENDGKDIINIETIDAQSSALNAYSDELADYVIADYVDNELDIEDMAESFAELYNLWAEGEVDAMSDVDEEEFEDLPEDLLDDYAEYNDLMLNDRNKVMAERAAEFIENGDNYFFMVGSLHFSGDNGVDDLLEDMGYTVERVA